ncbi:hypothetical protein [Streptomyces sp. NBC_01304]|uniref:hypothetical protein n=1 Tax=Streptomyces sp. NBC_01304 TaxID=2903818 RepID=UPI002E12538A|nr:hypothetical protein OG430_48650 [Streptomyces sp. NBC_01304]
MRFEIINDAIENGTAGATRRVRLEDWNEIEILGRKPQTFEGPLPKSGRRSVHEEAEIVQAECFGSGPYTAFLVGLIRPLGAPAGQVLPHGAPEGWPAPQPPHPGFDPFDPRACTWYADVPADLLRDFVRAHGGENFNQYLDENDWVSYD